MGSKIGVARINTRLKSAHCFPLEWLYIITGREFVHHIHPLQLVLCNWCRKNTEINKVDCQPEVFGRGFGQLTTENICLCFFFQSWVAIDKLQWMIVMGKFLLVNLKGRLVLHGMNALSMARASWLCLPLWCYIQHKTSIKCWKWNKQL